MVDISLDRPRRAAAMVYPYITPVLRHAGWFVVLLVLAPVLGPRGYGVFMLALGGVAIAEAALAEPLTRALISLPAVEPRHWSTALVTMMTGGGMLWLAARAGAPLLDVLVDERSFPDMFQSLAILPLLGGLAVVPTAALRRDGCEGTLIAANIAGFAAGAGIALSLAWAGAGAWSLVAQIIVQRLVECVLLWVSPGERVGLGWSARHFTELAEAMDGRAFGGVWPAVSQYAPCLAVGLILGPTAAGLYMLAAWLAGALAGIFLADNADMAPCAALRRIYRVLLPAVLASGLLAIALPPLIDLRWWGAVPPAQILLLGAIPAAVGALRSTLDRTNEPRWQAVQSLGGVAAVICVASLGLTAVALASVGWATVVAVASLLPIRRGLGMAWRAALVEALRPCAGAALASLMLIVLAAPVGLMLAPVPALCLLTACAWIVYLLVRGEPGDVPRRRLGLAEPG